MTFRNLTHITALGLVLFATSGCHQFYNGGYGLKNSDRDAVLAYERAKEERAEQVKQAELEAKRTGPIDFQAGGQNIETGPVPRAGFSAQTVAHQPANPRATGDLGLYGHVPNAKRAPDQPAGRH